jgi:hypothetical protein
MKKKQSVKQLGKQPPRYSFLLNSYPDVRFTTCPRCSAKTMLRKVPLLIHVEPLNALVLNKSCRVCPTCDLLIVHQDELEAQLAAFFGTTKPEVVGNDYLVLGTLDRAAWKEGRETPRGIPEMVENLHDFKDVLTVTVKPAGWYPADEAEDKAQARSRR